MDRSIGEAIGGAIMNAFLLGIVITALVVGTVTFAVTRYLTPTAASVQAEAERQDVINSLTPEQRKILGL